METDKKDWNSDEKELIELLISILRDTELDRVVELLNEAQMEYVLHQSNWLSKDFLIGYTKKSPDDLVQSFKTVDEQAAMDRLSSFALYSPLLQNAFRYGFMPPMFHVNPLPILPVTSMVSSVPASVEPTRIAPSRPTPIQKPVIMVKTELEHVNVVDSPSPAESSREEEDSSRPASNDSNINNMKQKKRVTCSECSKSFCDKGALKIHTSAVHLKEMHMCTIPGCGKEFSSRRSRNRHSSNTNPKLHMPEGPSQYRHDMRHAIHSVATHFLPHSQSMTQSSVLLSSVPCSSALDSRNTVTPDSQVEDMKPNVQLLGKRTASFNRTDEKRLSMSEVSTSSVPSVTSQATQSMLTLDLQLLFLQQLVQSHKSATHQTLATVRTSMAQ